MDNIVGQIVENDDFFPRNKFIERFHRGLKKQNYILSAPRRSGKSSILTDMYNNPNDLFHLIHFDVEGAIDEINFFEMIVESLEKEGLLKKDYYNKTMSFLSNVKMKDISFQTSTFNINTFIESILKNLQKNENKLIVLAIDEFSTFLAKITKIDKNRAKDFLDINRQFRLDRNINKAFRFIYTGSIGLSTIVEKLNYSKSINDLDITNLNPLNDLEAISFLEMLFKNYNIQYEVVNIKYTLDKIKWNMPFFIQLLFKHIEEYMSEDDLFICTNDIIDIAYENIFKLTNKKHFSHWKERLKDAYDKDEVKFLVEILNFIAQNKECDILDIENIKANHKLKYDSKHYINSLEYDGYILSDSSKKNNRFKFISPILQEWWSRNV